MSDPMVMVEGLTKKYGKLVALDNVSFELPPGCALGLLGRNGAGKTTLIRGLLGLTPISEGKMSVLGMDPRKKDVLIRQRTGYVQDSHDFYRWMRIREVLSFTASFYPAWDDALAAELVRNMSLDPQKRISELSKGMVAKVALICALAHRPRLLFLDEPTSGLDPAVRKEFLESLVGFAAEEGRSILISSHRLDDVERVADRIGILVEGQLRLVEDIESLKKDTHRVELVFEESAPETCEMQGKVSEKRDGRMLTLVVRGQGEEVRKGIEERYPEARIELVAMSLEEIFIALSG